MQQNKNNYYFSNNSNNYTNNSTNNYNKTPMTTTLQFYLQLKYKLQKRNIGYKSIFITIVCISF